MSNGFALIPARGGSKGIKDKNLQKIGKDSLVGIAIKKAFQAGFSRVIVLSDSDKIRSDAKSYGADINYQRPASISGDRTHMFPVYKWLLTEIQKRENVLPDYFCTTLCTTPFITTEHISQAKKYLEADDVDWVLSVNEFEHHPARSMTQTVNGFLTPTYNIPNDLIWANRQELPTQYRFNGGIIAGKTKHVMSNDEYNITYNTQLKIKPVFMNQEESFDIDTPFDLEIARKMYQTVNHD
jgi:CMP-N-acetylneuraminic acid synthetase